MLICVGSLAAAALLVGVQISGFGFHRSAAGPSGGGDVCSWSAFRLPSNAVPTGYNLTFEVALDPPSEVRQLARLATLHGHSHRGSLGQTSNRPQ